MRIPLCLLLSAAALLLGACATPDLRNVPGRISVAIDLSEQRAYLYKGRAVVLESVASTGREGFDTPTGSFRVVQKDIDHRSTIYGNYVARGRTVVAGVDVRKNPRPSGTVFEGAPMPYFLRINGAVGMHAGQVPGYPASHGCIRLPKRKARQFYELTRVGTPVTIRR